LLALFGLDHFADVSKMILNNAARLLSSPLLLPSDRNLDNRHRVVAEDNDILYNWKHYSFN
jgi:hypothetical protein